MDFNAAIQAHSNWKLKLVSYATGVSTDKLDAATVGKDNVCALGQWLYGEGKTLMLGKPEYQDLLKLHAEFHRNAASLIVLIDKGQAAQAKEMLDDRNSAYNQCSIKITQILMKLKAVA